MKRSERAHLANRGAQPVDLGHQEIGTAVEQVHREEKRSAGNSIAAIIRHARSMPGLRIRRNALCYSALRLLTDHQKREAIRRRDIDGEPVREIARSYNVSHSTISRLA